MIMLEGLCEDLKKNVETLNKDIKAGQGIDTQNLENLFSNLRDMVEEGYDNAVFIDDEELLQDTQEGIENLIEEIF